MSFLQGTSRINFEYDLNPYESFMRNHLKHYGYYTGRNENYRTPNKALNAWDRGNGYELSDGASDTEYENQALKDDDKNDLDNSADRQKRTTQLIFNYSAGKMVPKLREPRNLYALSKDPGPQQAPRWPADVEVLRETVQHIDDIPSESEPFYQPSGFEKTPMPLPEGEGRVVYHHPLTHEEYFLRSRVGGNRNGPIPRAAKLKSSEDTTLIFESRFESGNLMKAIQVSEFEYELELRYDLYTHKHTQWFYFRFGNTRRNVRYRFTITNFMKSGSLYNSGMRPLMYSECNAQTKGIGWRRVGDDIKYYKNDVRLKNVKRRRKDVKGDRNFYYSLTWTFTVPHDNDTCYFAHCYPYTYSDLQDYLQNLTNDRVRSKYCKQRILCRSLAGNVVYVLTITSPSLNPDDAKVKKAVVVTSRVHPGETNASWMMKGFLDYLTSEMPDAKLLRDLFVFKIVPMLNPDGVIVGNYRCSLAGRDLNRNYKTILKDSFPSVTHTKAMVKKLMEEREVIVYCDLHGHSRKQNVFIYGCDNKKNPDLRLKERIFPIILYNNAGEKFNYNNCKFKVQKSKEGTGRVVVWQMGIMNSYTMEASFCGSTAGDKRLTHFTTEDFEAMGYHFCDSLLDYCDPDKSKCNTILSDLEEKLRQEILAHLERTGTPLPQNGFIDLSAEYPSGLESSTTGSDSSADDGLPVHLIALAPKLSKKKKLKTRKERDKKRQNSEKNKEKDKEKEKSGSASSNHQGDTNKESEAEKKSAAAKEKKEKEKLRYRHGDRSSLHSAGRGGRQTLCRQESGNLYSQDKNDVKNLKKTEYLEALTNAYLMSGILKPAPEETASLRYSTGSHGLGAQGLQLGQVEGLCPHHEKAFAEQFVANQLAGLSFADDKYNWSHTAVETRRPVEAATSYHSAPPRERHAPATPSDPIQLISTTAAHGHPVRASSARRTPTRLAGSRRVSSPSKTIVSPADGVVEATGDFKKLGSEFVKRGVSSEALSLRSNGCATSTTYSVKETNKSMEASRQPPPTLVRHGGNVPSVAPDRPPSRGGQRPSNAMTPAGYQELLTRKGAKSEVRATQGIPLQLSVVMGTTHSTPSPNSDGADPTGAQQGQAQIIANPGSSITPVKKAEPFFMASEVLTQPQLKGHIKDSLENAPSESAFMSPSSQNWPKTSPQAKNHNCTTEATPISDPALYAKQNITPSSHHFKKAQDFYGGRSSPSPSQPERHPSPVSMGSAARLQAKYGRKSASAVHSGETQRSYRGSLKPASRSVDPNNNNSNTGMSTSTDDAGSNGIQSTSEDIGDDGKALLPDQTSSDSRSERIDGDYYYSEGIPSNAIEADGVQRNKGLTMNSSVETKLDIASRDINANGQKVTAGQERDYAKGTISTHARRLDKKAELKHLEKSLEKDIGFTNSPDDVPSEGDLRVASNASTHLNKQSYKVTLSQSATAPGHTHPTQGYSQITPRSRMDSTSPLQRSPRLLDRSTIQRGVDGSLHVRKPTPRERVKSGLATAQDLQDLGNGDVSELDVLISMDDNPYRVTLEQTPDTLIKETSPQPSARVTKPVTSGIYAPHSPRGRVTDPKRPLSSKRQDGSSPRQPDAHSDNRGDPHALQYFSVSKLSLQNRAFEKSPQPTPRSASSNPHDGAVVSDHPHGTRPGAHRPKTQNSNKTTATGGRGGKGKRSPRPQPQKGQDSPHVVVTQGGFMGHRTQPGHLKVHYSKKK
ncbi:uncharacterized protein LOC121421044 isoform X3 [Lytechinus variegatus]|uniref:uncharacterized protein LOC121421044 isoform X3 n=1 Tax=Lytechinus variegatus TaxID=7654 RepID=UPI001BB1F109|nr:uncharacterized protein LOC121421044 isoform X3 [Lytechinus variegatus]